MGYFDGLVVLITGAAHGMGEATARKLAASGARLGLADIDAYALRKVTEELGGSACAGALEADVTRWQQVQKIVAELVDTDGKLTDLVNCAGGMSGLAHPHRRSIETVPIEEWDAAFDLNVKSVFCAAVPRCHTFGRHTAEES